MRTHDFDGGSRLAAGRRTRDFPSFGIGGCLAFALFATVWSTAPARAADPQPYKFDLAKTGNDDLDTALKQSAYLYTLRKKAPVDPFALVARANEDVARLETALQSFGYLQAKVSITIAGRALSDTGLLASLDAVPKGQSVDVYAYIDHGALYHLRRIAIDGAVPQDAVSKLKLSQGQPAVSADVLAGATRLLTSLEEEGYALAKVDPPVAYADDTAHALDVSFKVNTGPKVDIGDINVTGLHDVDEDVVRTALSVHPGDLYRPSKIEDARKSVLALGTFSGVEVRAAEKLDTQGRIPLIIDASERPGHAVALTAAYSTDLGFSAGVTWSDRNLFSRAEQLNLSATINGVAGTAASTLGYDVTAQFIKPEFFETNQTFEADIGGIKQKLDAYDQTAQTVAVLVRRKFSPLWSGSPGLSLEHDDIRQEKVQRIYDLVSLPLTVTYDSTELSGILQDATHGARAAVTLTPTQAVGHASATFLSMQAAGSAYFDLSLLGIEKPTEGVLAIRAIVASLAGAGQFEVPPDRRLYAGGSATVRGYRYQSIGPLFPDNKPIGGTALDAGTIEFRQHLFDDFAAAAFIDAGQATATGVPFEGPVRAGAGAGVRYYTPLGPVRVDFALPLTRLRASDAFEVYIGLGQAF
jgi:translocation and assembly module TamA